MIYIRITKNLVLLMNDTVMTLFFSMKTWVDKYANVENFPEKWNGRSIMHATEISDDVLTICRQ